MTLHQDEPVEFSMLPFVEWTTALPSETVIDAGSGLVAVVGECGMGSEGFVAVQATKQPESLIWLATFDFSNPFESARLESGVLNVRNNMGEEWRMEVHSPTKIEIHGPSTLGNIRV